MLLSGVAPVKDYNCEIIHTANLRHNHESYFLLLCYNTTAGYGQTTNGTTVFVNASTCNFFYRPINRPIVFDFPSAT